MFNIIDWNIPMGNFWTLR